MNNRNIWSPKGRVGKSYVCFGVKRCSLLEVETLVINLHTGGRDVCSFRIVNIAIFRTELMHFVEIFQSKKIRQECSREN